MTIRNAPPDMFDADLLALRRARSERRKMSFLIERCLTDAADRICDINRVFENALIIGPKTSGDVLRTLLPAGKIPQNLNVRSQIDTAEPSPTEPAKYDLIISLLRLQSENDPVGALIRARQNLRPDGLFLGSMFGGDTLKELRAAFYKTDEIHLGGLTPHIFPFPDHVQTAGLLSRAGLALPVIDKDVVTVNYKALATLRDDLRDLGETNVLAGRGRHILGKAYWRTLEQSYPRHDETDRYAATFEILWLTGWAPHDSQQKPLERGSAQISLVDVFKDKP